MNSNVIELAVAILEQQIREIKNWKPDYEVCGIQFRGYSDDQVDKLERCLRYLRKTLIKVK